MTVPWYTRLYIQIRVLLYALRGGLILAALIQRTDLRYGDRAELRQKITVVIGPPREGIGFSTSTGSNRELEA